MSEQYEQQVRTEVFNHLVSTRASELLTQVERLDQGLESFRTMPIIEGLQPLDVVQRRSIPQSLRVLLDASQVRRALEDYDAMVAMGINTEGVGIAFSPEGSMQTGTAGDNVFAIHLSDEGYMYRPDAFVTFDVVD